MWNRPDFSLPTDAVLVVLALVPLAVIFAVALLRLRSARRRAARLERDLSDDSIRHETSFAARSEASRMQSYSYGEKDRIAFEQEKASSVAAVQAAGASALMVARMEREGARRTVSDRERDVLLAGLTFSAAVVAAMVKLVG